VQTRTTSAQSDLGESAMRSVGESSVADLSAECGPSICLTTECCEEAEKEESPECQCHTVECQSALQWRRLSSGTPEQGHCKKPNPTCVQARCSAVRSNRADTRG
jgi:hypothetical protein